MGVAWRAALFLSEHSTLICLDSGVDGRLLVISTNTRRLNVAPHTATPVMAVNGEFTLMLDTFTGEDYCYALNPPYMGSG